MSAWCGRATAVITFLSTMGCGALTMLAVGCAADPTTGHDSGPVSTVPIRTAPATAAPAPHGPTAAAIAAASVSAPAATASNGTCLMFYQCFCNIGCSKVAESREQLYDGLEVEIVSGSNAGSKAFVVASKDKWGQQVFSLTHDEPGMKMPCSIPATRHLMAFPCDPRKCCELFAHDCDAACE